MLGSGLQNAATHNQGGLARDTKVVCLQMHLTIKAFGDNFTPINIDRFRAEFLRFFQLAVKLHEIIFNFTELPDAKRGHSVTNCSPSSL